jgi:NAD(P)-dependent dehydrogenase (short-subunit alcohol dehydrogenase family)
LSKTSNQKTAQQVALIIGGASGIGAACASKMVEDGWAVAIGDISIDNSLLTTKADDVQLRMRVDVADTLSIVAALESVAAKFGRLDSVINTAGFTDQSPSPLVSDDDWDALIGVHLGGSFKVARESFPYLKSSGGSIINISSIAGTMGLPYRASYCAAKAGIEGLTRSLAVEWAEYGIRVNAVAPGWVKTALIEKDLASGLVSEAELSGRISLRRFGKVEEVSDLVAFLASDRSSYITGQVLAIDGGLSVDLDPGNRQAALQVSGL